MTVQRSSILRGPAIVQMGGQTFHSQGDITVTPEISTFPINSSIYGKSGERLSDIMIRISFTPVGMFTTDLLAVMFPHTNPTIGTSLFGATDTAVTLHPTNGSEKIVFTAGAITKMPGVLLSATDTAFKEMEITCLLKNDADRSAADALFTISDAAFTDTSFDIGSIFTVPYSVSLASAASPWDAILTEAGVEIDFAQTNNPVTVNGFGTVDMSLSGLDITVKMKPVGMTVAQVLAQMKLQGTGVKIGQNIGASANNMTITGGSGNPIVVVNNVRLKSAGQIYGQETLRHDSLEFIATRPTGGAMFSIGLAS